MTWQQLLVVVAVFLLWNVARDLYRTVRRSRHRSRQARTPLPDLFAVGNAIGDPDTGERWVIVHTALDMASGDDPRLSVDLIRRSTRPADPEGA